MKKTFLTIGALLAFMSLQAQVTNISDSRWLLRHPASPERAARILEIEKQQILSTGTYNMAPFADPTLDQIAPSQQYLQYFYEGQRELYRYNKDIDKKSDLKSLRNRYMLLYGMDDPDFKAEAEYYLGYIDYLEGKYSDALNHFSHLPATSKYNRTVPFYEMQINFLQGNYTEALSACSKIEEQRYNFDKEQLLEATRIKAECLLAKNYREEALQYFHLYLQDCKSIKNGPAHLPSSVYNAAILEYEGGEYAKAAQLASLATQSNDEQLRQYAYMLIGQSNLQLEQTSQAHIAFEQAAKGPDRNVAEAAAYNLCAIVHESNQSVWGDEIHILEDFLNNYQGSKYSDQVSSFLSEAYTTTRNYEAALASINKINQPNAQLLQAKQRLLHQLGIQQYVNGEYTEASKRFSECIQMGNVLPTSRAVAYFWRGECKYHMGKYAEAVSDYRNFLSQNGHEVQPELNAAVYYNLGYANLKQKNYADAINAFNKYVDLPDEKGTAAYNDGTVRLADCYYYTRQFASAQEYYHKVGEANCNQSDYALYQEALMLGLQKKYKQKQTVLDNLITLYPNSEFIDDAWLDKGRTYLLTNEGNDAIYAFQQVLDKYPDSPVAPQAAIQQAMTYNNLGQADDAARVYKLVSERYPGTDAAASAVEDLKVLSIQQRIASLPSFYEQGQYQQLIDTYKELVQQNVDFRDLQNMQLLVGKSYLALHDYSSAERYLLEASQDMRTSAGAEAKYRIAQMQFDLMNITQSQESVTQLLQSGTPHQYWLARGIILMSDIFVQHEETFTASEYLKSLKQNYTNSGDDIHTLVDQRLAKIEAANESSENQ